MKKSHLLVALAYLSVAVTAQEIRPGSTADIMGQAQALFATTNLITVNSATLNAEKVSLSCTSGALPEEVQFGVATGFLGANGFVLSNAYVENQDEENPPAAMGSDPFLCAGASGQIGGQGVGCVGTSSLITTNVLDGVGQASTSGDAVIYSINFTTAIATTLDLSYSLATFEDPFDVSFYDSFAISIEGGTYTLPTVLAGGGTQSGPVLGTDPWSLSASSASPSEYNSLPGNSFFVLPARTTGLRTIEIALDAATTYTLEFHVADGGSSVLDASCNSSLDTSVDTSLFVGLHTFQSGNPAGLSSGWEMGRLGHAAVSTSAFPPDFQVSLTGAGAATLLVLGQSPQQIPGFTFGLIAPFELLIGVAPFIINGPFLSSGTGLDVFPPTPFVLPPSIVGGSPNFQWWGNDGSGWKNSKGMNIKF